MLLAWVMTGLSLLPVGHHVDAVCDLLAYGRCHRGRDGAVQIVPALAAPQQVKQGSWPGQAAHVRGEDAIGAPLHLALNSLAPARSTYR
jgi:hypothetical protein